MGAFDYLFEKTAALKESVKLRPHQEMAVNKPGDSVIYAHAVGSGKTLTSIARFEKMKQEGKANKALVVVPAGLRDNFAVHGVQKFTDSKVNIIGNKQEVSKKQYGNPDPAADYNVISYEMFRALPKKFMDETGADTMILDENHRTKNEETLTTEAFKRVRDRYKNFIGLTGSVVSNQMADVLPLIDIATKGQHNLAKNKQEFMDRFAIRSNHPKFKGVHKNRIPVVGIKNRKLLEKELAPYVDYIGIEDAQRIADMPKKDLNVRKVPITREQARLYKKIVQQNPKVFKMIKEKRMETMKDDEAASAFSTLVEARKLMNSPGSVIPGYSLSESVEMSPKAKKLLDDLSKHLSRSEQNRGVLYTHLVNGGVDVLEAGLKDRGIEYGKFIGKGNEGVTEETRQQAVKDFNAGKIRAMIVSSAGGEGLSLNDTTWEGVFDPHYNPEKMKQMEARGIRSGGLKYKPEKERKVEVNRYIATMPRILGIFKPSTPTPDEFIYGIAENKERQNKIMFDFLKQIKIKEDKKIKKAD